MPRKNNEVMEIPEEVPIPTAICPNCDKRTVVALTTKPRTSRCTSCRFEYQDPKQALIDLHKEHAAPYLFT